MKEKMDFVGGFFSIAFTVAFAMYLVNINVPQSIASWTMWALLDIFVFVTSFSAGNKRAWLPLGFAFGAILVICILFSKSGWKWGFVETVSAVGSGIALVVWRKLGPRSAIVAIVVAMVISSIPAVRDAWGQINSEGWWYWAGISFCSVLSCYGAKAWTIEDRLFPVASFVFNLGMTTILFL